jgi:hypothetical protein
MLLVAMDNKLFRAPIGDNPKLVADIGTGTGIWAMYETHFSYLYGNYAI